MAVRRGTERKASVSSAMIYCGAGPVICTLMPVASEVLLGDRVRT
jgi:hypothetical protein